MTVVDVLRARLLETLAGQSEGNPQWIEDIGVGTDPGYFDEDGAAWTVHADIATLIAGPRALLMQALHPGAMAGVHDHSRYREDPFGRLAGTIRWVTTVTFGSREQADRATGYVRRIHDHVTGTFDDGTGSRAYAAADPELLSWVHLAFTDSFLSTHRVYGGPIPGGEDAYVREWAIAGELMGVAEPPRSVAELEAQLSAVWESGILRSDERVREAVKFLRRPPLPSSLKPTYPILFNAAAGTLPPRARALLGVRGTGPAGRAAAKALLKSTHAMLGTSATEVNARKRLARAREAAEGASEQAA